MTLQPLNRQRESSVQLSFEQFADRLCSGLATPVEVGDVTAESGLFDELGIDSLSAFELLLLVEDLAGITQAPAELPEINTVGDAYAHYLELCRAS